MTRLMHCAALLAIFTITATPNTYAQSRPYAYRYVSLEEALPPGVSSGGWFGLSDDGRVFGSGATCDELGCTDEVVFAYDGVTTEILYRGVQGAMVNRTGTVIAGTVVTDWQTFSFQPVIMKDGSIDIVPALPGQLQSWVMGLTDAGAALIVALTEENGEFKEQLYLYHEGRRTFIDFAPYFVSVQGISAQGLITGYTFTEAGYRAVRYDPKKGAMTLLAPLPTEQYSWGMEINASGQVLGYSWDASPGDSTERIGYWDRTGTFHELFLEGTPEIPTLTNRLLWNDAGLAVLTAGFSDPTSYIVPGPGVRLSVAELTTPAGRLPAWNVITGVNAQGDLLGYGGPELFAWPTESFLLQRL
jgi:hypothetical protein